MVEASGGGLEGGGASGRTGVEFTRICIILVKSVLTFFVITIFVSNVTFIEFIICINIINACVWMKT